MYLGVICRLLNAMAGYGEGVIPVISSMITADGNDCLEREQSL